MSPGALRGENSHAKAEMGGMAPWAPLSDRKRRLPAPARSGAAEGQRSPPALQPLPLTHRTGSENPKHRERDNATKGMGAAPNNGTEKGGKKGLRDAGGCKRGAVICSICREMHIFFFEGCCYKNKRH